ncbi:MAG: ABC-type oligopeptide transport system substrate-binding subunit [Myxococcota bacterium]|jgi:ABC-type oligopeptide transport system substrate-binding subunit
MIALLLLVSCGPSGPTFGLSRSGEDPQTLVFNNATEPEYIDPGQATGHPDGRIIAALFDGLTEYDPVDLSPRPGIAASWETHPDGRGYTFDLRDNATWTNGRSVTALDFVWSWERVAHPIFLGRYAQQLYSISGAQRYNESRLHVLAEDIDDVSAGETLELVGSNVVGLGDDALLLTTPEDENGEPAPVGSVVEVVESTDTFVRVQFDPDCPSLGDQVALMTCDGENLTTGWVAREHTRTAYPMAAERVVTVSAELRNDDGVRVSRVEPGDTVVLRRTSNANSFVYDGKNERFGWLATTALTHPRADRIRFDAVVRPPIDFIGALPQAAEPVADGTDVTSAGTDVVVAEPVQAAPARRIQVTAGQLITTPSVLGMQASDDHTLSVRLEGVAPYFLQQTSHTTLRAVPKEAVMAHGARWTRPENIVSSGPFTLQEHIVRDKWVLAKNEDWWNADDVRVDEVIAYSIDNQTTSVNLYRAGYTDFVVANDVPAVFIPMLSEKEDFHSTPKLSTYFYRLNTTVPPLDDPRVRRALSMAINRDDVVLVNRKGDLPASHIVPPGLPGYTGAPGPSFDPEEAQRLLAEAGFPGGEGFPSVSILYNTLESHKLVAAVIQEQWRQHLGINIELENREWKTYLKTVHAMEYDIARAGWIGDYLDPNTFLDLWVTDGGNNETGWSNAEYDALIDAAGREPDPATRLDLLRQAEAILAVEMPFLPIYWYADVELRQPDVRGYHSNLMDQHPLQHVWLDR